MTHGQPAAASVATGTPAVTTDSQDAITAALANFSGQCMQVHFVPRQCLDAEHIDHAVRCPVVHLDWGAGLWMSHLGEYLS